ncbi:N-acetylmannosamine kinase [Xaviernesmea oryzae]|uniref:Putative N-acetylmannosamine-6-phosphate 2-epimerase n=1 Tax=Xaviernesmea oryzae TaxID=464029 RepID=A0A1Q9ATT3_9HYPH|nr:putative N-acetylmannosamine-6-phosphate 2-epimerase [Xaviernesmea oryzae]OLP58860.1 N-acetylmannosamine kinase [Xaviernesmea oryzae]SEM03626.1 N-acetylmannosamine-6-phosphate 2-epimerase / N-acetylmannosamine kinase [Xaviernesmea oryzae]
MVRKQDLENSLIVSCQPVPGGPMDTAEAVVGFARAALSAGAKALRIESVAYVRAVRAAVSAPIIGLVKRDLDDSPVRITPFRADVEGLVEAGADIIAFDATDRPRPVAVAELAEIVRAAGRLSMADCASAEDGARALVLGIDFIGTTMSGYTGGPEPVEPDLDLIQAFRAMTPYVIAEGRIRTTDQAAAAIAAGAYAVVVGSAITRTEHATSWFLDAVTGASRQRAQGDAPVLAIDLGGTKTSLALVQGGQIVASRTIPTDRSAGPDAWLDRAAAEAATLGASPAAVGLAVTGFVDGGRWSAMNPATLGIPEAYPLVDAASARFGVPVLAVNDAQAAAWGEFRLGAGQADRSSNGRAQETSGIDLLFLTISTGIGGGIIAGGRLLTGLSGHFGIFGLGSGGAQPLEDMVSGGFIAAEALRAGHALNAAGVFAAAENGAGWAEAIVSDSAERAALLLSDLHLALDPALIVIGGGIGLAPGYLDRLRQRLSVKPTRLTPRLAPARLGPHAGLIGVAALAGKRLGEAKASA